MLLRATLSTMESTLLMAGLLPMKFFFTGGTQSGGGEMQTWDAVKERIKRLVEEEDKANPLSDDDLVKKLSEGGVNIARRTVTKYRKAMGIFSSRQRRDWGGAKKT